VTQRKERPEGLHQGNGHIPRRGKRKRILERVKTGRRMGVWETRRAYKRVIQLTTKDQLPKGRGKRRGTLVTKSGRTVLQRGRAKN